MFSRRSSWRLWLCLLVLTGLALPGLALWVGSSAGATDPGYVRLVRAWETDRTGLQHPAGLAFSPEANLFYVLEAAVRGKARLFTLTPSSHLVDSTTLDTPLADPANIAYDGRTGRLLLATAANDLLGIQTQANGGLAASPPASLRSGLGGLGLQRPQGMTLDPASRKLFILDPATARILAIQPDAQGGYDGPRALAEGRLTQLDLQPLGITEPHGLAYHPGNGHLYLMDRTGRQLYELSQTGQLLATLDLSPFGLVAPQGLLIAPSSDPTDDPSILNLYIADAGLQAGAQGSVVELSFTQPAAVTADVQATLVNTINAFQWAIPSTDPAGIAYDSTTNTLLVSDSEIDETVPPLTAPVYWQGVNVWNVSLPGNVLRTWNTIAFSNEPTGVAYNPANHHVFYTDDDQAKVFEVDPGPDGVQGTPDDIVTWFSVKVPFSANPLGTAVDAEGITFDTSQGHLFIADGTDNEIYDVSPGANGRFDGVPPAGDDQVTHFDTTVLGALVPESVEFNPDNGHLYILSGSRPVKLIVETTRSGALIGTIGLANCPMVMPAGLAYAPASNDLAKKHFYVVDRGVDSKADPNENDGKIFEIEAPPLASRGGLPWR